MAVRLKDVAEKAGVDASTVSLVLSNNKRIPEQTRRKVLEIIREMNYYPHKAARHLAKGKTDSIAIITNSFTSVYTQEVLRGIESYKDYKTYDISFYSTRGDKDQENTILHEILFSGKADVIIGIQIKPEPAIVQAIIEKKIHYISIGETINGLCSIVADDYLASCKAAELCIRNGKHNIAFITSRLEKGKAGTSLKARLQGYQDSLEKHSLPFDTDRLFFVKKYDQELIYPNLKSILERQPDTNGIICTIGDVGALHLLKESEEMGIRVPEILNIILLEDIEAAQFVRPSLSALKAPVLRMGQTAFQLSINALQGQDIGTNQIIFIPELMKRESA